MRRPVVVMAGAILALVLVTLAFGVAAERLGDWTDAHPERAVLAWSLWNAALLVVLVAAVLLWRSRRRGIERQSGPPAA
jgi:cytochrome c-type biogenesis protein CcmH/NrfF